jgi:2-methylcitrate dehydratase PrpD
MAGASKNAGSSTLAGDLARLVLGTSLADLPLELLEKSKVHLLDQLGAQLLGSVLSNVEPVRKYAFAYAPNGPSTVVGSTRKLDAEFASLVNATNGHAFEIDDMSVRSGTHPGCESIPAALAVAEEVDASGKDFLRALALGLETAVRVGLATMPSMLRDRGFHEPCPHSVVASALVAGLLRSISVEDQVMALAIAASHASGLTEYAQSGGEIKRLHPGLGAMGGIRAVRLAEFGLTGPPTIFEGKRGFLQAFTQTYDAEQITKDWGKYWQFVRDAGIKAQCCVGSIQSHIEAITELRREHSLDSNDIGEIVLGVDPGTLAHVSSIGPEPSDIVGAQFSAQFIVALNLVRGSNGVDDYEWAASLGFRDPEVSALAHRIQVIGDPECAMKTPESAGGKLGKVSVRLLDGRVLTARAFAKGYPANPMTRDEVEEKYYSLAGRRVSRAQATEIADAVWHLERLDKVSDLTALLSCPET